jgi:DtxR family Mn-dependent transcriptional regulator
MFLVEKMGFGWEEVHQIAEEVEHVHVPAFFEKMDELLDYPTLDPHGSPIPDKDGNMAHPHYVALSSCQAGDTFTLRAVEHAQDDFLAFLNDRHLSLGVQLRVQLVETFDASVKVQYQSDGPRTETLSREASERLLGERQLEA